MIGDGVEACLLPSGKGSFDTFLFSLSLSYLLRLVVGSGYLLLPGTRGTLGEQEQEEEGLVSQSWW